MKMNRLWIVLCSVALAGGCNDGPMFALKKINPYYRSQWAKDRQLGPTYYDRIAELRSWHGKLKDLPPSEQQEYVSHIATLLEHDPSPDMRREAALLIGEVNSEAARPLLKTAAADESIKVRMAVCESAGQHPEEIAVPVLQPLLSDPDLHGVRPKAVLALGNFDTNRARELLAATLNESDPGLQYAATQALAQSTGQDFGGSVADWKAYLSGEPVEPPPTIAAQAMELLGR